jgi:hypothetical protein
VAHLRSQAIESDQAHRSAPNAEEPGSGLRCNYSSRRRFFALALVLVRDDLSARLLIDSCSLQPFVGCNARFVRLVDVGSTVSTQWLWLEGQPFEVVTVTLRAEMKADRPMATIGAYKQGSLLGRNVRRSEGAPECTPIFS